MSKLLSCGDLDGALMEYLVLPTKQFQSANQAINKPRWKSSESQARLRLHFKKTQNKSKRNACRKTDSKHKPRKQGTSNKRKKSNTQACCPWLACRQLSVFAIGRYLVWVCHIPYVSSSIQLTIHQPCLI